MEEWHKERQTYGLHTTKFTIYTLINHGKKNPEV